MSRRSFTPLRRETAWTYDGVTNGKGKPYTSTNCDGVNAYTTTIGSYDALHNTKTFTVDIPTAETGLSGSYAYTQAHNIDGSLGYVNTPAVANLPAEQSRERAACLPTGGVDEVGRGSL